MKLNCCHVNEGLPSRLSEQLITFTQRVTLTPTSNIRVELRLSVDDGCLYTPTPAVHAAVFIHPPLQCELILCGTLHL